MIRDDGFAHLHLHSHGSFAAVKADGCAQPDAIAKAVADVGQPAVALTDHGNMIEVVDMFKACKKHKIKFIPGMEAYMVPDVKTMKEKNADAHDPSNVLHGRFHLTLLAISNEGYKNLLKLHEAAWVKHYYYKPNIDWELLANHSEGIVCLTGCPLSMFQKAVRSGDRKLATNVLQRFKDIYGDRLYVEVQRVGIAEFDKYVPMSVEIAKALGVKIVASNDVHFIRKEDNMLHDIAICINNGMRVWDKNRKLTSCPETYLKSSREMFHLFKDMPEALENTLEIVSRCNVDAPGKSSLMPTFPIPKEFLTGLKADQDPQFQYFVHMVRQGFKQKIPRHRWEELTPQVKMEIRVIAEMGFSSYFLVVQEFINWAKRNGIPVGPGRGCLAPDVKIVLNDGTTKFIKDISVGDVVFDRYGVARKVKNKFEYVCNENLLKIRTYYGDCDGVSLTLDHKVLCEKVTRPQNWVRCSESTRKSRKCFIDPLGNLEWIPASDVQTGDWLFVPKIVVPKNDIEVIDLSKFLGHKDDNEIDDNFIYEYQVNPLTGNRSLLRKVDRFLQLSSEWFELFGYFTGDGWTRSESESVVGLVFNQKDYDLLVKYKSLIQTLGIKEEDIDISPSKEAKIDQMVVRSRVLFGLFQNYLFKNYKRTAQTKHVPDLVIGSKEEYISSYLRGFMYADGHIEPSKIKFTTTSRVLADQVRLLCNLIGLPSSLNEDNRIEIRQEFIGAGKSFYVVVPQNDIFGFCNSEKEYVFKRIEDGILLKVLSVEEVQSTGYVYDFEVETEHNYLTSSFIVHNSAAGSLVCFCLGITDTILPADHGLIFERFLNMGRKGSPPDIDTDISYEHRQKVIQHVREFYGTERVAIIGTTGTFKPKTAIRDVGKVLCIPDAQREEIARAVPEPIPGTEMTFDVAFRDSPKLRYFFEQGLNAKDEEARKLNRLFRYAMALEGNKRHVSKHAAGVVIMPEGMTASDVFPIMADTKDQTPYTGVDMHTVEDMGALKMDFLGLKTLDILHQTALAAGLKGGYEDVKRLCDLNDPKIYETVFKNQDTCGIFQFESEGMKGALRQFGGTCFNDLVVVVSAMRPGPKDEIPKMADVKWGRKNAQYDHPDLEAILAETYGVILYQEQAIKIFQVIFGFNLVDADLARRAIGKKKADEMAALREKAYDGAVKNGYTRELAKILFDKIEKFAGYAFNKCFAGSTLLEQENCGGDLSKDRTITIAELYKKIHGQLPATAGRIKSGEEFKGPCVCCGSRDVCFVRGFCRKCNSWLKQYRNRGLRLLAYDEESGRIVTKKMKDVYYQGKQVCYRITTESGHTLDVTSNHKSLTNRGWLMTSEMNLGDCLAINQYYEIHKYTPDEYRLSNGDRKESGPVWGIGEENYGYIDGSYLQLKQWSLTAPEYCEECGVSKEYTRLERVHLDGNRRNNSPSNLKNLCVSCHKKYDYRNNNRNKKWDKGYPVKWSKIVSIECVGEMDTYDIEMEDPHTIVANGIVSHNSHAAVYAAISAHCAWCKTYYPAEFMAQCFNYDVIDKFKFFIEDCRRMGIEVRMPDVRYSRPRFAAVEIEGKKVITFGYELIKNVGTNWDFHKKSYNNLYDFIKKNPKLDATSLEWLIKSGALDCFGLERGDLLANLNKLLGLKKKGNSNQQDIFDIMNNIGQDTELEKIEVSGKKDSVKDKLRWEMECLGYGFSGDFKMAFGEYVQKRSNGLTVADVINNLQPNVEVSFCGLVYAVKAHRKKTKDKETGQDTVELMFFMTVGDFDEQIEIGLFKDGIMRSKDRMNVKISDDMFRKDDLILVNGFRQESGKFVTNWVEVLER